MLRSYTAADALTIGNASCGTIAIFLCLDYVATGDARWLWIAFVLLPLRWLEARARREPIGYAGFFGAALIVAAIATAQFGWHWLGAAGPLARTAAPTQL
jgi:hypothetical protein